MKRTVTKSLCMVLFVVAGGFARPALATPEAKTEEPTQEDAPRIAIVVPPDDPLGRRLVAEFETLGLDTVLIAPEGPVSRASLELRELTISHLASTVIIRSPNVELGTFGQPIVVGSVGLKVGLVEKGVSQ